MDARKEGAEPSAVAVFAGRSASNVTDPWSGRRRRFDRRTARPVRALLIQLHSKARKRRREPVGASRGFCERTSRCLDKRGRLLIQTDQWTAMRWPQCVRAISQTARALQLVLRELCEMIHTGWRSKVRSSTIRCRKGYFKEDTLQFTLGFSKNSFFSTSIRGASGFPVDLFTFALILLKQCAEPKETTSERG